MRDEMIGAVLRRAIEHPEFRQRLIENPQSALADHGFALGPEDMQAIERMRTDLRGAGGDVEQRLVAIAEEFGIEPKVESQ